MGQGQSSNGATPQIEGQPKVDYYELLGVERQATDEEIKKAYRRKALELHPDRNYGNTERATQLFAEIQSAHEVLSDAQERAWYDSHRDVFLGGSQTGQNTDDEFFYNIRMTTADDVLKLMMKYNGRLDYNSSTTGFYGALRDFFGQLAKEEEIACRWENMDPVEYPDFGQKDDDYHDVVRPFYAAWNGFVTRKSYSWKDSYRLSDAPDRRVRRLLEKQNKGLRDDAIREFNDAVRSLVAFVRKRDLRYQENQKSEDERQKILRDAAAAQSARSRAARQAKLDELDRQSLPQWAKPTVTGEHEGGFSSEEDSEQHEIECVVCSKTFKSEAQFGAHEKSKKHVKLRRLLQREMTDQDEEIGEAEEEQSAVEVRGQLNLSTDDDEGRAVEDGLPPSRHHDDEVDHDKSAPPISGKLSDQGSRLAGDDSSSDEQSTNNEEDGYAPRSDVENRLARGEADDIAVELEATIITDTTGISDVELTSGPKLGKAKQKRAKKLAQKGAGTVKPATSDFKCAICQADFPSKTKLFNHIKEKGHAAPVAVRGSRSSRGKGTS